MALPFFYIPDFSKGLKQIVLDEETSAHVVQVLRMKTDGKLNLTNGKGTLLTCSVKEAHKKHCIVNIDSTSKISKPARHVCIGISLVKNTSRFEWFLEKATEIGISEIIPILCSRTITEKFRIDRLKSICVSAMLQSQQCWLPVLHEPTDFTKAVEQVSTVQNFIAHCEPGEEKAPLINFKPFTSSTILIGPEGDFSSEEIQFALSNHFLPVSLGDTRLRTETAGIVASVIGMS